MSVRRLAIPVLAILAMPAHAESPVFGEDLTFSSLAIERLEQQFDIDITVLDIEAWYGTDAHKLVAKLDAELDDDTDYELELLYSRPFSAYFDLHIGLRTADQGYTGRSRSIHQELRDRKVALFIDKLPQGVWEIRYDLRAEVPGRFHALPVLGHAMYVPEIRCNSNEIRIDVLDRGASGM